MHSDSFETNQAMLSEPTNEENKNLSILPKRVQFGTVTIQEYPIIIGCNPAVSAGVPMTIDWEWYSQTILSMLEYDTLRAPQRLNDSSQLLVDSEDRYVRLHNLGFTYQEMRLAEQTATMIRKLRYESYLDDDDDDDDDSNVGHWQGQYPDQRRWSNVFLRARRMQASKRSARRSICNNTPTKWWNSICREKTGRRFTLARQLSAQEKRNSI
jgi:hypothetical protein